MSSRPGRGPDCVDLRTVDLGTVDLLARLRLRAGVRVVRAPRELWELLDLCGLVEVVGQIEEREERRGVQEERHLPDPPA